MVASDHLNCHWTDNRDSARRAELVTRRLLSSCEIYMSASYRRLALICVISWIPCCKSICLGNVWKYIRDFKSHSSFYR